jgi:uncharacterized membrane protein YdjX (TVP38/TMEM64 family)
MWEFSLGRLDFSIGSSYGGGVMRLVLLIVGFSLGVLGIWMIWGGDWESWADLRHAQGELQGYGVSSAVVGFGLLVMDLVLPVPGTVVMSALGYLHGVWWGGCVAFAGATSAGMMGYGIGALCPERWARRFLGDADYVRGGRLFARGGGWVIALSRAVPILPEALAVSAGMVRMPWRVFLLSMTCGNLPMAFLFSWVGASGRSEPGFAVVLSFALPGILWATAWWWQRGLKKKPQVTETQ